MRRPTPLPKVETASTAPPKAPLHNQDREQPHTRADTARQRLSAPESTPPGACMSSKRSGSNAPEGAKLKWTKASMTAHHCLATPIFRLRARPCKMYRDRVAHQDCPTILSMTRDADAPEQMRHMSAGLIAVTSCSCMLRRHIRLDKPTLRMRSCADGVSSNCRPSDRFRRKLGRRRRLAQATRKPLMPIGEPAERGKESLERIARNAPRDAQNWPPRQDL